MLSEQLRKLRKQKNLTQKQLADYLHVTDGAVAMWEHGRREPDIEILTKLADFYGVTVDYLLGREITTSTQQALISETIRQIESLNQLKEQLQNLLTQD
ncbi:MAG: helix-turn-helix transcriptional regulator [Oscillospiraceae bacterium]|nr:helix-turn-helix transcriptional regulator [Oscillospiraceae bacterium]